MRRYYIPRVIQIDEFKDNLTWSDILLKFILMKHDKELKDWDLGHIQNVEENFGSIMRGI